MLFSGEWSAGLIRSLLPFQSCREKKGETDLFPFVLRPLLLGVSM